MSWLLGGNKILLITLVILFGLLAGSGWLLKQSYRANGEQSSELKQWQHANNAWSNREAKIEQSQQKMIDREEECKDMKVS